MITRIEVDGFKSLNGFHLVLEQGLNVLVGPNGVGKTNITLFLEFLSHLIEMPVGDAVRQVGGAGTIFQKIGDQNYVSSITASVHGCHRISDRFLSYRWEFRISTTPAKDKVFFEHQEFRMRFAEKFVKGSQKNRPDEEWPLLLHLDADGEEIKVLDFLKFDRRKVKGRFPAFRTSGTRDQKLKDTLKFLEFRDPINNSLVSILYPYIQFIFTVLNDLRDGETFNIIPSRVRDLEDSASTPGIHRDGSGLAATLYAMKRAAVSGKVRAPILREQRPRTFNPVHWHKVIAHLRNANSSIADLDVTNQPFDNKLVVKVTIVSGEYRSVLPLSAMSDGTIKWLALITAILTSKSIFAIEEPENFLHPWMQAEIANVMRNHLQERVIPSFVLMTTHSESLLNFVRPEEVVIIDLLEGRTQARRIKGLKAVREAISNSGFGLGFFYFSNALSDV